MEMLPFTDDQLFEFFGKWFGEDSEYKYQQIREFFVANEYIKEVCRSPMVATLVAGLVESDYELPQSKCDIYEKRFDLMLNRWDRSRGVASRVRITASDKTRLLSRLALSLHAKHEREFTVSQFTKVWRSGFSSIYPESTAEDVLRELRFANNVIIPESTHMYSLGHLSYQEFLAAKAIVFSQNLSPLINNFHQPWWRQVLIFYAGIAGDLEAFTSRVLNKFTLSYDDELLEVMMREARYTPNDLKDAIRDMSDFDDDNETGDDMNLSDADEEWEDDNMENEEVSEVEDDSERNDWESR